jgi:tetratricopeptide (TPR) repeat protein
MVLSYLSWIALLAGAAASVAALWGHYRVLPAWLTGPEVCQLEAGGCAVLFRSPRSRLLGVPNALLGVVLYLLLGAGFVLEWPAALLLLMTLPALAMSAFLGYSLLSRRLQCRICWTGHVANAVLALTLVARLTTSTSVDVATGLSAQAPDPDDLYRQRENIASAQQAEGLWAGRLAKDTKDFESAWKLARVRYWLGGHAPEQTRKAYLENGIAAGRQAIALAPNKPDGHFWVAANMGALAESFGLRQGLKYRGDIKDALEQVLKLDAAFLQGSADRALGRWYFKVPGLFGGSDKKSEQHLRKALAYNPQSIITLYFLGETLIELGKKDEARLCLQKAIDAPFDPEWAPEDKDFKQKAHARLATLR